MFKALSSATTALILIAGVLAMPVEAGAANVGMGQTLFPAPGENDPTGGNILATLTVPFVAATFTGSLTSTVIDNDPSNPLNGLTFTYVLTNDAASQHPIGRFTVNGFTGATTDTSYQTPATDMIPTYIDRPAMDVIGFTYSGIGPGVLSPGLTSAVMVIQTDAPSFFANVASIIDGTVTTAPTFSPVPEPGTGLLLVVGAFAMMRRRFAR